MLRKNENLLKKLRAREVGGWVHWVAQQIWGGREHGWWLARRLQVGGSVGGGNERKTQGKTYKN